MTPRADAIGDMMAAMLDYQPSAFRTNPTSTEGDSRLSLELTGRTERRGRAHVVRVGQRDLLIPNARFYLLLRLLIAHREAAPTGWVDVETLRSEGWVSESREQIHGLRRDLRHVRLAKAVQVESGQARLDPASPIGVAVDLAALTAHPDHKVVDLAKRLAASL